MRALKIRTSSSKAGSSASNPETSSPLFFHQQLATGEKCREALLPYDRAKRDYPPMPFGLETHYYIKHSGGVGRPPQANADILRLVTL